MKLLYDVLHQTHWPSWLRGVSVSIIGWSLVNQDLYSGVCGFALYVVAYYLQGRIPYHWN